MTAPRLTEREVQVLDGMARGLNNGQIGREIYVSEDTVKTHARRLYRKLGAKDRAHAVHLAHGCGLLRAADVPPPPRPPALAPENLPTVTLQDCDRHVELLARSFYPSTLNRPAARARAREGLRRLLGTVGS